ncbi:condensation domain-containing protein [Streptomyces roseifaciens]|uniref:condensation domain-containing protein n=1 Tax=Streptomyces roseifaciens TaxID=1488406 RepID=UPI0007180F5C|nr:condensation domain-containing protein [Streptomyces roseifaciens]
MSDHRHRHRHHDLTVLRPATVAQTGIWAAQQQAPDDPLYNCAVAIALDGTLDHDALRRSVARAVAEADTLRTRFHATDNGVGLTVEPAGETGETEEAGKGLLGVVDLSGHAQPEAAAEQLMDEDLRTATDLATEAPCTHVLFVLGPQRSLLYFRYHHIALDGFGQYLHCRRLAELYTAYESGRDPAPSAAAPLAGLLDETAAYLSSPDRAADAAFWRDEFAAPPQGTPLTGRAASSGGTVGGTALLSSEQLSTLLGTVGAGVGRWSATIVAATAAYTHRLTGHPEVITSLPMAARHSRAALATPAMLANVLPLRLPVGPATTFARLVGETGTKIRRIIRHQRYPTAYLRADLGLPAGSAALVGPEVNVMAFGRDFRFGSCATTPRQLPAGLIPDLALKVYRTPAGRDGPTGAGPQADSMKIEFLGNATLYTEDDIATHRERFLAFLESAAARPDRPLSRLPLPGNGR